MIVTMAYKTELHPSTYPHGFGCNSANPVITFGHPPERNIAGKVGQGDYELLVEIS